MLPHAKGRMLDVGCGIKPFEAMFKGHVDRHDGVDMMQTLDVRGTRADVFAVAGVLPFANESFDTVLCTQMLDDVPEPVVVLDEIRRVLKPGGKLILTINQMYPVHDPPHDYYRFTRYGLEHIVKKANLTPVFFRAIGGAWLTAGALILMRSWDLWGKIPLLGKLTFIPALFGLIWGTFFDVMDRLDVNWAGAPFLLMVAEKT